MLKLNVTKLPKSEVEIEGELEAEIFESYWKAAFKRLSANVEIDGFRKGKVPESVLLSKIPEIAVLEEMAEMALGEHYPEILEQEKIDAIGRPQIAITKIARGNPLGFKIKTAVLPEIQLGDYKKIAKTTVAETFPEEKDLAVTDEEVENTIMDIRKSRAPKKHMADMEPHVHKEGEEHDHSHDEPAVGELPEFNDDFVKGLGPFENVEEFKSKLKDNIKLEKGNQAKEKTRLKIIEQIIEKSEVDVPELLIEAEVSKILYRMESDISQMGLKFEDYLKHLNKSVEDMKKEFRGDGEKKAKLALVLSKIAEVEKILVEEELIAKEVAHILEHYKEADPERVRAHAENVLTNEKVFAFLENQ